MAASIKKVTITTEKNVPVTKSETLIDPTTQKPYVYEYETHEFQEQHVQDFELPSTALPVLSRIPGSIGFWDGRMTGDVRYLVEVSDLPTAPTVVVDEEEATAAPTAPSTDATPTTDETAATASTDSTETPTESSSDPVQEEAQDLRKVVSWHTCALCNSIIFAREGDKEIRCPTDDTLLAATG